MHLTLLPVLVPLSAAVALLALHRAGIGVARAVSGLSVAALAAVSLAFLARAGTGEVSAVALGNWPPPFGIAFVADRLSAGMVAVTTAVAAPALLAALGGADRAGRHFHPFFQLQLAGLNGAFLTGDLFNLFVFFEVLLIASYGLLAHGGGPARARAGLHYVAVNLTGSTLFLFALGLLYGSLGTLNIADVAERLATLPAENLAPARAALALLLVVFGLKAALLPIGFWLPHAYGAATAPVAALFAVLTKVGLYSLLRLETAALEAAPGTASLVGPWLAWVGIGTILFAAAGVLSARRLGAMVAHLVLLSMGMLAAGLGLGGERMVAAMAWYLPHTTLVSAGLFLLAGLVAEARGAAGDGVGPGPRPPAWLGAAFLLLAVAVAGLPPLSGFLGKVMLLSAAPASAAGHAYWAAVLLSSLAAAVALARAGSRIFWEPAEAGAVPGGRASLALLLALLAVPALVLGAAPLSGYARAAAEQAVSRAPYLDAVLPERPR